MCFRTIFYSQKFPVNRQNTAWKKSSHSTVLRNASGGPKFFLLVVEAPNSHHVSCIYSNWRKWVQFGPTHSRAIFGRCEMFTSVIAICWKHSYVPSDILIPLDIILKHNFTYHRSHKLRQCALVGSWGPKKDPRAKTDIRVEQKVSFGYADTNYGSGSCDQYRTWWALTIA